MNDNKQGTMDFDDKIERNERWQRRLKVAGLAIEAVLAIGMARLALDIHGREAWTEGIFWMLLVLAFLTLTNRKD